MTPAARHAAAITCLDRILGGAPAEQVLTAWARGSRFAGSGDRLAVRDLVFAALRRRRSLAAIGGVESGRGLILGLLRAEGRDPSAVFTGEGHAPPVLTAEEAASGRAPEGGPEALDCPDWLWLRFAAMPQALAALQRRAPVDLRVCLARAPRDAAQAALAAEGIETVPVDGVATALRVQSGERKVAQSRSYLDGLVELQDAASQAAVLALPLEKGMRILDLCAGGGGKALAMAARAAVQVTAHDIDPRRLSDLPARAARAGARIEIAARPEGLWDMVLVDAPCSGSGTWRRAPDAKWRLTEARLSELVALQGRLLRQALSLVRPGGVLAYMTCSLFGDENDRQIRDLQADAPELALISAKLFQPEAPGDGFFVAILRRPALYI